MVDAHASGACPLTGMEVQVLSSAQTENKSVRVLPKSPCVIYNLSAVTLIA